MAETPELREDEPHPASYFPSTPQFGTYLFEYRVLGIDESLEVVGIAHWGRDSRVKLICMIARPSVTEAAPFYFTYINQVAGDDPIQFTEAQMDESLALLGSISESASLHRYLPEKWSIRQVLNHITDNERAFAFRMLWFARGFETPLPGYDQDVASAGAEADAVSWVRHVEEFRQVRLSTISLMRNMPPSGWQRGGIASEKFVAVRALAYIIPGHAAHHLAILRERYL